MATPKREYYIIETNCPYMDAIDQGLDPDYGNLLKLEKERKLVADKPGVTPRACLKQERHMIIEDVVDEDSGFTVGQFKESIMVAKADAKGRLFLEKGQEDHVRRILRNLQRFDKNVKLDETGLQLPEDQVSEPHKGGRGHKKS